MEAPFMSDGAVRKTLGEANIPDVVAPAVGDVVTETTDVVTGAAEIDVVAVVGTADGVAAEEALRPTRALVRLPTINIDRRTYLLLMY